MTCIKSMAIQSFRRQALEKTFMDFEQVSLQFAKI